MKRAILLCVLMACTNDDGDGGVDAGSNDDAGTCDACSSGDGGSDAPIAACPVPDSCTGNDICLGGACVPAYPRTYLVTNIAITVPSLIPGTSQPWDVDGPPDLYVAKNGDNTIKLTNVAQDQLSPTFAGPIPYDITATTFFQMDVWDDDGSMSQYAFGCTGPTDAIGLRERTFRCLVTADMTLTATINPQ